jgi:hypothetical protein
MHAPFSIAPGRQSFHEQRIYDANLANRTPRARRDHHIQSRSRRLRYSRRRYAIPPIAAPPNRIIATTSQSKMISPMAHLQLNSRSVLRLYAILASRCKLLSDVAKCGREGLPCHSGRGNGGSRQSLQTHSEEKSREKLDDCTKRIGEPRPP